jgi:glutaredoxin
MMMTFFRTEDCKGCGAIQEALRHLCMAHETVVVSSEAELPAEAAGHGGPPILVDEHEVIGGSRQIIDHLEELERYKSQWYKYQSDVCYCDDEGDVA